MAEKVPYADKLLISHMGNSVIQALQTQPLLQWQAGGHPEWNAGVLYVRSDLSGSAKLSALADEYALRSRRYISQNRYADGGKDLIDSIGVFLRVPIAEISDLSRKVVQGAQRLTGRRR